MLDSMLNHIHVEMDGVALAVLAVVVLPRPGEEIRLTFKPVDEATPARDDSFEVLRIEHRGTVRVERNSPVPPQGSTRIIVHVRSLPA